ncbi:MAG TPA: very short patch repair endonuclease [Coriobacteriia bacterium]|nr:MAG: DNA mismatch endonuclease Vsr [Actinobacteria bacterium 66_15]HAL29242.1 very short patch repair endonuclease [Coriobacteriia bacterium]
MDTVDARHRSEIMAAIKRKDTSVERALRSALWASGLRGYRVDYALAPGRPDIAFTRQRIAVFVDGCFWHMCPQCYREPKTNTTYWRQKLDRNVKRDKDADEQLRSAGWIVVRLWEHEVEGDLAACVTRIQEELRRRKP